MSGQDNLGSPHGGGRQGEPVEGSLTDGGSLPGAPREDRSFGAHRAADADEPGRIANANAPQIFEGQGEDPGATAPAEEEASPGAEHSGYGNTPPR